MVCCLCGEQLEVGQVVVKVVACRVIRSPQGTELVRVQMENGQLRTLAHALCPPMFGAPMELVGVGRERDDV